MSVSVFISRAKVRLPYPNRSPNRNGSGCSPHAADSPNATAHVLLRTATPGEKRPEQHDRILVAVCAYGIVGEVLGNICIVCALVLALLSRHDSLKDIRPGVFRADAVLL